MPAAIQRWITQIRLNLHSPGILLRHLAAIASVVLLTVLMFGFRDQLGVLNVLLLFLLLTLGVALIAGAGPATWVAILGFLAFDFFFIPPYQTLSIAATDHVLALFVYVGIALGAGRLIARVRERTDALRREGRRTALLYELNAALIGGVTLDAILERIVERVVTVYGAAGARLLLPGPDGLLECRARYPKQMPDDVAPDELSAASGVMDRCCPAPAAFKERLHLTGHDTTATRTLDGRIAPVLLVPIETTRRAVGVLEVTGGPDDDPHDEDDEQILLTFASQAALALERARLTAEAARAEALAQSDELKSALVAAVSHDLRTPLASIKASVTSLLDPMVVWNPVDEREFLEAIDEETDRLTMVVTNLLDLSRIEGGALRPVKEWYDVGELVNDIAERLHGRLANHQFRLMVEPRLPLVHFDYVEIGQVLINLLENAVKYTKPGSAITLSVRKAGDQIVFSVRDNGPGIPRDDVPRVFDRFYRADTPRHIAGAGIGLTISKGLVEAHGGQISLESKPGRGATFRFTLPVQETTDVRQLEPALAGHAP